MSVAAKPRASEVPFVGDYQLIRRLGSGSMGEVWLGRHGVTGTLAAVKLLRQNVKSRDRIARTFDRERRAIGRLAHPHIVPLFDTGPEWLATAYIDGTDLARRLKTPVDPATAVHLTLQIASALAHAHAYDVVHRDVKPSNILIDNAGNAFLADFGLAQLPEELDGPGAENRVGTPAFMAPEQMRGEVVGPQADQYALARTLIEMLVAGTPPSAQQQALAELPAELPETLKQAIARATSPAADRRFSSMSDFAAALASVDLTQYPAPRRLAPEVRVRLPYRWLAGADRVGMVGPDIQRADFRLSNLLEQGLVSPEVLARFQARSGYAEIGWTLWGNSTRIGRLNDPAALARTTEVVVLVHGMFCTRDGWDTSAPAVCRDNAQAVVLALDVAGFGDSRFTQAVPDREFASPQGLVHMILELLSLLGLRDLPTVVVGHSMAAAALLTLTDDDLGDTVSRLAITPVFPAFHDSYRNLLKMAGRFLPVLGASRTLRRLMGYLFTSTAREYTAEERAKMIRNTEDVIPGVIARVMAEYGLSSPAPGDKLMRCMVLISDDDPVAQARILGPALDRMQFPRTHVRRMTLTRGHFPHSEQRDHPEWTQRNLADIVACISSMLRSSSEGSPMATQVASTVLGEGSTQPGAAADSTQPS